MKKIARKTVSLHRETLRTLTARQATRAAGGLFTMTEVEDACYVTVYSCRRTCTRV